MRNCFVRLSIVVLVFAVTAFAQKRSITEKDLFDFTWVADPQISPDGSTVAFVKVTVNAAKTNYDTSVWSVSTSGTDEPHRMTSGTRDSTPRWSPDGKYLAFVRSSEASGAPGAATGPQLYMLSMAGGDSFQFTNMPRGAGGPSWSPDGMWIAFSSGMNADEVAKMNKQPAPKPVVPAANEGHDSDVRVITRAVYRSNGGGYNDNSHPNHLWMIAAPHSAEDKVTPTQVTSGDFSEGDFVWAKDGSKVYFTSRRIVEQYYELPQTELFSVSPKGGEPTKITTIDMGVGGLAMSPDGKRLAFAASTNKPVLSYTQPDLWVMDIARNAQPKNLTTAFDFWQPNNLLQNHAMRDGDSDPHTAGDH